MQLLRLIAGCAILSLPVSALLADDPSSDPYSCSASKPCKIGCCSKTGVCGLGPQFCGSDVCISSCDAKSECDPGWGAQWSNKEGCPLNVCCSKYGFCGTTSEFCGSKKVAEPSCGGNSASQKVIGYYEGWSSTRQCRGMYPEDLLLTAYTHMNYAFAFVDPNSFAVAPMSAGDTELYPRFTALKKYNPGLQTWISIGGWSMNDPDQPTAATFSNLAGSADAQSKFFKSLVNFMSTYGFDGVDIDWEYPVAPERSGKPADFANYVSFLKNLKNALGSGGHNYGLTITLPSSYWYMQNFDIKSIEPIVDWFNVMTYDLHGTWDSTDPYIGAVVNAHTNLTEITQTFDLLWRNSIDPSKVVMGMGFYGRSFTLSDPSCNTAGCPFSSGGNPGPCSASAGTLMYSEIEDIVSAGATVTEDKDAGVAIVTWGGNQWVSYDNADTLKQKMDYANGKCLGGVMIWAASTDDASGTAIKALTGAAGRNTFTEAALFNWPKKPIGQCVWGDCDAGCPTGFQPATGTGGKVSGYAGIFNGCKKGSSRYYCCPTGSAPKCEWKGTAPFCGATSGGRCSDNEVEVTTSTSATGHTCWTGHKSLCCSHTDSDNTLGQCSWEGSAPFCTTAGVLLSPGVFFTSANCPSDKPNKQTTSKYGPGGDKPCLYDGGWKSYCCANPNPWANSHCAWHQGTADSWTGWAQSWIAGGLAHGILAPVLGTDCKGECPAGQVPIATDGTSCQPGTYSYYCCDNPNAPALPAPGDISLCPSPPGLPGRNSGPDPDGSAPHIYAEADDFDGDCTLYALSSSTSKLKARDLDTLTIEDVRRWEQDLLTIKLSSNGGEVLLNDFWEPEFDSDEPLSENNHSLEARSLLAKRTLDKGSKLKFCSPGQPDIYMYPQTYSGYRTIARLANKGWITIAKPAICGAIGVASLLTQPNNEDFVTEHVFEKQSLRNAIQYMTNGKLPGGGALSAGKAAVTGVFDATGAFFSNWPSALTPSFGDTPQATAFGALGHAQAPADYANLQVCDADLNAIKERIVAGITFLSSDKWKAFGELEKVSYLSDVIDTFSYMRYTQTAQSYNAAYKSLVSFWSLFSSHPSAQAGYDYVGAFKQIVSADIDNQVSTATTLFKTYLQDAISIWNDPSITGVHPASVVTENQDALADFLKNIGTYISLDKLTMTS
ncbi:glycoside hydrolase family 18 protein [Xylona heveae TC161]|uniref:chitinase n=1 Tax=Xylona heveae (strain CBS 132557 / TC161) TaxID=1328760 RepID=A0A165ACF8_XYLHT|nr:glycoside hydrolase family 18 protein [Xylona heveae TC161]KZF20249.1 glycoside hydrolase family 18 protein [Xylona heveae TC161]